MSACNQVNAISTSALECPICMDSIEGFTNRVVTECGHAFHCSCLMQNASHNGFGCPYCRTKMADEQEEEDDEEDYESIEDESIEDGTIFQEDALTSFRMFHQQINGEEVEEEVLSEWGDSVDDDDDAAYMLHLPDAAYMAERLVARGITFEDLVKNILYQEHSNFGMNFEDYERRSCEVYGQFRALIAQYSPPVAAAVEQPPAPQQPAPQPPAPQPPAPVIAESKSVVIPRRWEFIAHV